MSNERFIYISIMLTAQSGVYYNKLRGNESAWVGKLKIYQGIWEYF